MSGNSSSEAPRLAVLIDADNASAAIVDVTQRTLANNKSAMYIHDKRKNK